MLTPIIHRKEIQFHIVVEADPQTILERRFADKSQRVYNLEVIRIEVDAERGAAYQIAAETGASVYIVKNETIIKSAEEMKNILRQELKRK